MHEEKYKRTFVPRRDIIIMSVVFLWVLINGWILANKYGKKEYAYSYGSTPKEQLVVNTPNPLPDPKPLTITVLDTRAIDSVKKSYEQRIASLDSTIAELNARLSKAEVITNTGKQTDKKTEHIVKVEPKKVPKREDMNVANKDAVKPTSIAPPAAKVILSPAKSAAPVVKLDDIEINKDSARKAVARLSKLFKGITAKPFTKTDNGFELSKSAAKLKMVECCIETNKRFRLEQPLKLYFTLITPDGHIVNSHRTEGYGRLFSYKGSLQTKSTENDPKICCKLPINQDLKAGIYVLALYTEGGKIGETKFQLTK